ncbi:MAG: hypothetical protein HY567_01300 [Candidatus Kerfeldbacteria bacterium]|nr:hypothetical protein [Candidatus Kerfeldbacteria bacterium]
MLVNILVVINDEAVAELYRQKLGVAREHQLTLCSSRQEALAHARRQAFDAVIVHGDAADAKGPMVIVALKQQDDAQLTIGFCPNSLARRRDWELAGANVVLGPEFDLLDLLKALGVQFLARPLSHERR